MTHNHPLYKVDNGLVFDMIEISVRGHDVAATIAPFHVHEMGMELSLP
jgi:hypothetical protein